MSAQAHPPGAWTRAWRNPSRSATTESIMNPACIASLTLSKILMPIITYAPAVCCLGSAASVSSLNTDNLIKSDKIVNNDFV